MGFTQKIKASEKSDALICLQFSATDNGSVCDIIISNLPLIQELISNGRLKDFFSVAKQYSKGVKTPCLIVNIENNLH